MRSNKRFLIIVSDWGTLPGWFVVCQWKPISVSAWYICLLYNGTPEPKCQSLLWGVDANGEDKPFIQKELGSCEHFYIPPTGAQSSGKTTSPRPTDILMHGDGFHLWWKNLFLRLPSPSKQSNSSRRDTGCFSRCPSPSSLLLWLCVCWLLSSSQMAVIIQTWDLASRLLWTTLDGLARIRPPWRLSFISCVITSSLLPIQPPHDYSLYEEQVGWIFVGKSLHLFLQSNDCKGTLCLEP